MLKKGNKKEPLNEYSLHYEDIPLFPRDKKVNKKKPVLDDNSSDRHNSVFITRFMVTWYNRSARISNRIILPIKERWLKK